jgi:hypothetical protein
MYRYTYIPYLVSKMGKSPSKNKFGETLHQGNELNGKKRLEI